MPTEKEILMIQKATMYDLKKILEADPDKTYTVEELNHSEFRSEEHTSELQSPS